MEHNKDFPIRADSHIKETESYKVFNSKIPSEWVIRDVTERDYGIDCYIELVDDEKRLTGEIAFVQLKSTQVIEWKNNCYKFYNVTKSTTNYLNGFKIPTFIFLVDLLKKEMFFLSVKEYILQHYKEYMEKARFAYEFSYKRDLYTKEAFLENFKKGNLYAQYRSELQYFITNVHSYIRFMQEHNYRDEFMQIETEDMMLFEALHRNIDFLQKYYNTNKRIPSIKQLADEGNNKYGNPYEQTLFEGVLTNMFDVFKESVLELVDIIKKMITSREQEYWMKEKNYIFWYFLNLDEKILFDY